MRLTKVALGTAAVAVLAALSAPGTVFASTSKAPVPSASTACPAKVNNPNISLWQDSKWVGYWLTQTCNATDAGWEILGPYGWDADSLIYPGGMYSIYYPWWQGQHLGRYTLQPIGAWDASYNSVPQATEYFYVRQASHTYIYGYRSGNWVYAHAYVNHYNTWLNSGFSAAWTASAGRYVTFYNYSSGAWRYAGYKWTGTNGWTPWIKIWAPTHRNFRVIVSPTWYGWGWTSSTIWR